MKWFLAKLVFRIVCGHGDHVSQFEEQLRLIWAEDEFHAFHKARLLGEGDHLADPSEAAIKVSWKFIDVTELHLLAGSSDGAEVHAMIKEEPNAEVYIRSTKKKATQLLQNNLHQFTNTNSSLIGI